MTTPLKLAEGEHLFTSESVTEGHPDKIADQVSDATSMVSRPPSNRLPSARLVHSSSASLVCSSMTTPIETRVALKVLPFVDLRAELALYVAQQGPRW